MTIPQNILILIAVHRVNYILFGNFFVAYCSQFVIDPFISVMCMKKNYLTKYYGVGNILVSPLITKIFLRHYLIVT